MTKNGYVEREVAERHFRSLRDGVYQTRQALLDAREEAWAHRQNCETALRFLAAYSSQGFQAYLRETA